MTESHDWSFWAAIAAGGVLGAWVRWSLARLAMRGYETRAGGWDPSWATLAANLLACLLLGGFLSLPSLYEPATRGPRAALAAFATIGVCGSLSTFSTLCADAVRRARTAPSAQSLVYLSAHLLGGPLALWLGSMIPR